MIYKIPYKNIEIRFDEKGNGLPIVLLHGYIESLDIWEKFADRLSNKYRVISIDLLGHGQTGILSEVHTMEDMADAVDAVIKHLSIDNFVLVGHSMGGYVSLAYLEKYPKKIKGLVLFHSSPFADNETKKAARDNAIADIKNGKKIKICKDHVPKTFATTNIEQFVQEIGFGKIIALNTPEKGIIAALEGMKQRKDRSKLLEQTEKKILWIFGKEDKFIPSDAYKSLNLKENIQIVTLENSGHQGYIEEEEKSFDILDKFIEKL